MEYKNIIISSLIEIPFDLLNIENGNEIFIFQFIGFDEHQSDISIQKGGVTGTFGIQYTCDGLNCKFNCDITVGKVYDFYQLLEKCYKELNGIAVLQDYSGDRTRLSVKFEKSGECILEGVFKNMNNFYRNGITVCIHCDQTYIEPSLHMFKKFFLELARIQGYNEFLY